MIFTYYLDKIENTIDIDIDDIMILYPMLNGHTTAVMFKKDGIEYSYIMLNKFETIPLNNNFLCIYKAMKTHINIGLITIDMLYRRKKFNEEVTMFKFKNIEYVIDEYSIREMKIRNLILE